MGRPRAVEPQPVSPDPAWEFHQLAVMTMATEPEAEESKQVLTAARTIKTRAGTPTQQIDALWAVVGALGLGEAGERHLASLRRSRECWSQLAK